MTENEKQPAFDTEAVERLMEALYEGLKDVPGDRETKLLVNIALDHAQGYLQRMSEQGDTGTSFVGYLRSKVSWQQAHSLLWLLRAKLCQSWELEQPQRPRV